MLRWYPTLTETFVYREIEELQRRGQTVIVWALGARPDGALNDRLPQVEVWRRGVAVRARWRRVKRVHAHFDGEASIAARRLAEQLGIPWSVTVHATGLFRPRAGFFARLRAASPVITVCEHHRSWLEGRGIPAVVVRSGVTLPEIAVDPSNGDVVAVARNVPKKDLARLQRACPTARMLSDATPGQVESALRSAALFALPCRVGPRGGRDGVPVAMMEAMALGIPVVTRPVAGIPELVDEEVGWIDTNFEAALESALGDPDARRRRGRAARDRVRAGWTIERSVSELQAAWDRLPP